MSFPPGYKREDVGKGPDSWDNPQAVGEFIHVMIAVLVAFGFLCALLCAGAGGGM